MRCSRKASRHRGGSLSNACEKIWNRCLSDKARSADGAPEGISKTRSKVSLPCRSNFPFRRWSTAKFFAVRNNSARGYEIETVRPKLMKRMYVSCTKSAAACSHRTIRWMARVSSCRCLWNRCSMVWPVRFTRIAYIDMLSQYHYNRTRVNPVPLAIPYSNDADLFPGKQVAHRQFASPS